MTMLALFFKIALATATVIFVIHTTRDIKADLDGIFQHHNAAYSAQLQCIRTNSRSC
jgi:cell division protein FtsL